MAYDIEKIEGRLDRAVVAGTEVSMELGGVKVKDMGELMELARLMSLSGVAVPYHLRGNPGTCLAVAIRALRSGFDPFMLAEHSYTMAKSQKSDDGRWEKVETLAFDSFVIRAIIEAHANLTGPLRYTYQGEGDEMTCTVTATPKGEKEPLVHTSMPLGHLKNARGRNDKGDIKGSPLWETNPKQQLGYATGRDFCRRYFPQVLMGYYDRDEMDENVVTERAAEPVKTSGLRARLAKPKESQDGFDHAKINKTIDGEIAKSDASVANTVPVAPPGLGTEKAPSDPGCFPVAGSGGAEGGEGGATPSPPLDQVSQGSNTPEASGTAREAPSVDQGTQSAPQSSPQPALCGEPAVVAGPDGSAATQPSGESNSETPRATEGAGDGDKGGADGPPNAPPEAEKPAMVAWQEAGEPGPPFNGTYVAGQAVDTSASAAPKPAPIVPKDGSEYARWVDENLPDFDTKDEVDTWWRSEFEKRLRNTLPNMTQERLDEAKEKVKTKLREIAYRNKGA